MALSLSQTRAQHGCKVLPLKPQQGKFIPAGAIGSLARSVPTRARWRVKSLAASASPVAISHSFSLAHPAGQGTRELRNHCYAGCSDWLLRLRVRIASDLAWRERDETIGIRPPRHAALSDCLPLVGAKSPGYSPLACTMPSLGARMLRMRRPASQSPPPGFLPVLGWARGDP